MFRVRMGFVKFFFYYGGDINPALITHNEEYTLIPMV